ncbi:MAG: hypothetical protein JWP94_3439 [Mucilaginibacter sp.]|nr:hypothetical protein [Mucilaginibacter sp.]
MKTLLILVAFVSTFLISCAQEISENNPAPITLIGKWKVVAAYSGYVFGDFKWHAVLSDAAIYQFNPDSSFITNSLSAQCFPANYKQVNTSVFMYYKCNMRDSVTIEKLTSDTLIFRRNILEGYVINKLISTK